MLTRTRSSSFAVNGALTRAVQFAGRSTGQGDNKALIASSPCTLAHRLPHRHSWALSTNLAGDGNGDAISFAGPRLVFEESAPGPNVSFSVWCPFRGRPSGRDGNGDAISFAGPRECLRSPGWSYPTYRSPFVASSVAGLRGQPCVPSPGRSPCAAPNRPNRTAVLSRCSLAPGLALLPSTGH